MESNTLNVSLPSAQLAWVRERKQRGEYKTLAAVIQELIREKQEAEATALRADFERLSATGADGPEPVDSIVTLTRKVKRERHAARRA